MTVKSADTSTITYDEYLKMQLSESSEASAKKASSTTSQEGCATAIQSLHLSADVLASGAKLKEDMVALQQKMKGLSFVSQPVSGPVFSGSVREEVKENKDAQDEKSAPKKDDKAKTCAKVRTMRISKRQNFTYIQKLFTEWDKVAKKKESQARHSNVGEAIEKNAGNSAHILEQLQQKFPKKATRDVPYVALDTTGKVQGIALVVFEKDKGPNLKYLLTNPENIKIEEDDVCFRGAGTALIAHIVREIEDREEVADLFLESITSAKPFYTKLGFELSKREAEFSDTHPMLLKYKKIATFLEKYGKESQVVAEDRLG